MKTQFYTLIVSILYIFHATFIIAFFFQAQLCIQETFFLYLIRDFCVFIL